MISVSNITKSVSYTCSVIYTTFDTLLNPTDYLENELLDSSITELGLNPGEWVFTSGSLVSVTTYLGQNSYNFTLTITSV